MISRGNFNGILSELSEITENSRKSMNIAGFPKTVSTCQENARKNHKAKLFFSFLKSNEAKKIIQSFGYRITN